jgi:hypothetical protein
MSGDTFDFRLKSPVAICISGPTQAGKSTLTARMLERRNEIIDTGDCGPIDRVMYCYTEWQALFFAELKTKVPCIEFHKGLPEEYSDGTGRPSIVVLDDLQDEVGKSEDASNAFTRKSHHSNINLILLTQTFFHKNLRTVTANVGVIILMKNPRNSAFVEFLARQMNGGRKNELMTTAYKKCISKQYGYLVIDLTQTQDDRYRLRSSIFPEDCIIFTNKT